MTKEYTNESPSGSNAPLLKQKGSFTQMYGAGYSVNIGELLQKFRLFNSAWTHNCSLPGCRIVDIALFLFGIHTLNNQSSQWSNVISFSYLNSSISTNPEVPEHGVPDWVQVGVI